MIDIRKCIIVGDVARVPLTKGYWASIDACDIHLVDGFNWHAVVRPRGVVYANRAVKINGKSKRIHMHREIFGQCTDDVDHIDRDGLNNRKSNLRAATKSENAANSIKSKRNRSGFKGATFHKATEKWQSVIRKNGRDRYLGLFSSAELAHAAYVEASIELNGAFARAA